MRAHLNGHSGGGPDLRAELYAQLGEALSIAGYEHSTSSRLRSASAGIRGGSADSHRDANTRDSLRKQCQQLDRNNVLARGLVQRLIDMVVGDGFVLEARTEDPEWNAKAEELFNAWAENDDEAGGGVDLRGKSSIDDMAAENVRAACFDGDLLYVKTGLGSLQAIEAERIRNPGTGVDAVTAAGTLMVGGVEMDGAGRALRYHVSGWAGVNAGAFPEMKTAPVRADACLFLVNPIRDITGATRGEPQMQAALSRFDHLEGFDESARVAARIHAIMSAFIVLDNPQADILTSPGTVQDEDNADGDSQSVKHDELEPGMMRRLRPGESIQTVQASQPGPEYERFILVQVVFICANLGIPLPLALLDARQVNLSSMRSVMQLAWRNFERWQAWLIRKFYRQVYTWRIAMFMREGRLPFREDWAKHDWMARTPPVMDPKVEVEAARARVDAGMASHSRVMREVYGIDSAAEWEQCQKDRAEMKKRGVVVAAAPGAGPGGGGGGGGGGGAEEGSNAEGAEGAEEDAETEKTVD